MSVMNIDYAICLPFGGRYIPPEFAVALATLQPPMNCNHSIIVAKGLKRDAARNCLVQQALELGVRYILFLDDDTVPPQDAVQKLMFVLDNSEPDVAVCAGVYTTKTNPPVPTILQGEGTGAFWRWRIGDVFQCMAIGTGMMLIKAEVFKHVEKPWFVDVTNVPQARELGLLTEEMEKSLGCVTSFGMTDDVYFCKKLEFAGYKVLAHGGVMGKHFDEHGNCYELPKDSYPYRGEFNYPMPENITGLDVLRDLYPFPSLKPDVPERQEGWCPPETRSEFQKIFPDDAKVVVELGTWLGQSAQVLCEIAPQATIICVDHWLGSIEHHENPKCRELLPKLYRTFIANVWEKRSRIIPMKTSTQVGLREIAEYGIKPEVIYFDASHAYVDVKADIELARELFPDAILCGDDYDWESVGMAVTDVVDEMQFQEIKTFDHTRRFWWIEPQKQLELQEQEMA